MGLQHFGFQHSLLYFTDANDGLNFSAAFCFVPFGVSRDADVTLLHVLSDDISLEKCNVLGFFCHFMPSHQNLFYSGPKSKVLLVEVDPFEIRPSSALSFLVSHLCIFPFIKQER